MTNHEHTQRLEDASDERRQALARSLCLHRYFDNASPQRMRMCNLPTGHEGPCGQKGE